MRLNAGVSGPRAARLDTLPGPIAYEDAAVLHGPTGTMRPMVAIGGDPLVSLGPDLADVPTFVVAGPRDSGRSAALLTACRSLLAVGTGLVVLAPRPSPLRELRGRDGVAAVLTDPEVSREDFRRALDEVPRSCAVIVVDDADLFMGARIGPELALLARGGAGNGRGVLAAGSATSLAMWPGTDGWVGRLKRNRSGMLLSPQDPGDGEVIGVRLPRGAVGGTPRPGRGLLHLGDGTPVPVRVPLSGTSF